VKFAGLLRGEVVKPRNDATTEQLERELLELRLLAYCRPALGRKARR
jgi:hypothetical protein